MKNVDELYKKYYDAYKSDYETDDELNEAKKKKFDYKQFGLVDKTDKESKLDEETKNFLKQIEKREKGVDKKGFMKYFNYQPTALVNKLLSQNTQDLKKSLNEIKEQKIELNKDERNSTNNKNENDRLNMILSVIDRIYRFFEYKFLPNELKLPKWVNVSKETFNEIQSTITKAKKDGLVPKTNVDGREITLGYAESLLKGIASGKIKGNEFKREYNNIVDNVEAIVQKPMLTRSQEKTVEILFLLKEILKSKDKKTE